MTDEETAAVHLRATVWEQAKEGALVVARRINQLCIEASKLNRNLAVGPLELAHDERPTISGHYCKTKFEYQYLYPGEGAPIDWQVYHVCNMKLGDLDGS